MDFVQFDHVSKRYTLGQRMTAREAIHATAARFMHPDRNQSRELWSLHDVSFSVSDGESLGIVGRNGAGKSTILKIMAGITAPTSGVSRTRGRVAALLEVGTGFHPELTGRENIFLNGAILGMSRRDILSRFDEIVDFSGVEPFLSTPVKRYSSGMYLRLAFAVAAHLEPDVLVVDEVLAVGDAEFQRKCVGRMQEAEEEGRTLVFVSHDLTSLARLCGSSIWLEGGTIRDAGPTGDIVRNYLSSGFVAPATGAALLQSGPVTVLDIRVSGTGEDAGDILLCGDPLRLEFDFTLESEVPGLDFTVVVTASSGVQMFDEALSDKSPQRLAAGSYRVTLTVPPILNFGDYTVGLWFGTPHEDILFEPAAVTFTLHGGDVHRSERLLVLGLPFALRRLETGA